MSTDELYAELRGDIAAVANPLFDFSEQCLKKRGNFLPHGAVLDANGKVGLVAASPDPNGRSNSTEVLPLLHEGLRAQARERELVAIGIAENVTVTPQGQPSTEAIKVLFEHKRGLVVALYLPFKKKFLRGYSFGQTFTVVTTGEVNAWAGPVA
ncbi:MAG: hypothetical protein PHI64_08185 [Zoogloea sp.]|uniref:hypothetical protein n=1 Tax=Zoogloea sp. TaxID=49181 RepID=UPI002618FE81|nr:hypothetical protein [Zoogloea sp.]MDD2988925.1 hypothetical protein [Zoogloea sp.]